MKKIVFTLVLSMVLSMSVFAEGETHDGGRACTPEQTCSSGNTTDDPNNTDPIDNTDNTLTENSTSGKSETTVLNSTLADFYLFLNSIL